MQSGITRKKPKKHGKGNSFVYMSYPIPKAQAISKLLFKGYDNQKQQMNSTSILHASNLKKKILERCK
jgi:hypothetical protein